MDDPLDLLHDDKLKSASRRNFIKGLIAERGSGIFGELSFRTEFATRPSGYITNGPSCRPILPQSVRILTSAFLKEAFDRGAEQFQWKERIARQKRSGTKGTRRRIFIFGSQAFNEASYRELMMQGLGTRIESEIESLWTSPQRSPQNC